MLMLNKQKLNNLNLLRVVEYLKFSYKFSHSFKKKAHLKKTKVFEIKNKKWSI